MVKSVVGEEAQLKQLEDLLSESAISVQVGLVIGKLLPDLARGFIYKLIPTPSTDTGLPACSLSPDSAITDQNTKKKRSTKGSSAPDTASWSLLIDTEWITEHARQVSRMLLGGMHVIGVYIWVSDNTFKNSIPILGQLIKVVANASQHPGFGLDEMLLLHLSYSPKRWTCRNVLLTSSISTALQLCDFKLGKSLPSIQHFNCIHNFEIRLPIHQSNINSCTFKDILYSAINILVKELDTAEALIDGNLVGEDLVSTLGETSHKVELLLPFGNALHLEVCSTEKIISFLVFCGAVSAHAYLGSKTPIHQVISDIKDDIINSLWSRLQMMSEEFEKDIEVNVEEIKDVSDKALDSQLTLDVLKKYCNFKFPKRVLVPWFSGVFISDYINKSETFEDLQCHFEEVMSMDASENLRSALEVEKDAQGSGCASVYSESPGSTTAVVRRYSGFKLFVLIAIALILLSVFIKLVY